MHWTVQLLHALQVVCLIVSSFLPLSGLSSAVCSACVAGHLLGCIGLCSYCTCTC